MKFPIIVLFNGKVRLYQQLNELGYKVTLFPKGNKVPICIVFIEVYQWFIILMIWQPLSINFALFSRFKVANEKKFVVFQRIIIIRGNGTVETISKDAQSQL